MTHQPIPKPGPVSTWIVKVKAAPHLLPVVVGNIEAGTSEGRDHIKPKARAFVRDHFGVDAVIVGIARGFVSVRQDSEWEEV